MFQKRVYKQSCIAYEEVGFYSRLCPVECRAPGKICFHNPEAVLYLVAVVGNLKDVLCPIRHFQDFFFQRAGGYAVEKIFEF